MLANITCEMKIDTFYKIASYNSEQNPNLTTKWDRITKHVTTTFTLTVNIVTICNTSKSVTIFEKYFIAMSIGQICDGDCTAIFNNNKIYVLKN